MESMGIEGVKSAFDGERLALPERRCDEERGKGRRKGGKRKAESPTRRETRALDMDLEHFFASQLDAAGRGIFSATSLMQSKPRLDLAKNTQFETPLPLEMGSVLRARGERRSYRIGSSEENDS